MNSIRKKIVLVIVLAMIFPLLSGCGKKDEPTNESEPKESSKNEMSSNDNKGSFEGKITFNMTSETGDDEYVIIQTIKGDNIKNEVKRIDGSYVTFYSKEDKAIYSSDKHKDNYYKSEDIDPEGGREVLRSHDWYAKMFYDMAMDKNANLNVTKKNETYLGEPVVYMKMEIKSLGVEEVKIWYSEKYNMFLKLEEHRDGVVSGFAATEISKEAIDDKEFVVPSNAKIIKENE